MIKIIQITLNYIVSVDKCGLLNSFDEYWYSIGLLVINELIHQKESFK